MGKKTYGYVRVSSRDQNIDRQIVAMEKIPIRKEDIYIDRQARTLTGPATAGS